MLTTPETLAAYLYLHLSEPMPEPIYRLDGEIDVESDNQLLEDWSFASSELSLDMDRLERFITQTERLLSGLVMLQVEDDPSSEYMTLFYDAAKEVFDHDKTKIRTYFLWLYLVLFQRPDGPRWGEFVQIYGVEDFVTFACQRFENLF